MDGDKLRHSKTYIKEGEKVKIMSKLKQFKSSFYGFPICMFEYLTTMTAIFRLYIRMSKAFKSSLYGFPI